jgi:hypothetical protein
MACKCISEFNMIWACKGINETLDLGLQMHLQTHLIIFFKAISKLVRPRPPSALLSISISVSKCISNLVLPMGRCLLPVVRVRTANTVRFSFKSIQKCHPLHLGGPNLEPYLLTCPLCQVWPVPSVPISGSCFQIFLCMVTFKYPIDNRKILTFVYCCPFLMDWPPL